MVPLGDVNKALKGADWPSNMDFFEMWEKTDKGRDFAKKYPEVITLAKYLYGRIKSQGMHAGGVVFSNEDVFRLLRLTWTRLLRSDSLSTTCWV
jgi:DNA polymerase III alpha subunit